MIYLEQNIVCTTCFKNLVEMLVGPVELLLILNLLPKVPQIEHPESTLVLRTIEKIVSLSLIPIKIGFVLFFFYLCFMIFGNHVSNTEIVEYFDF